MKKLVLLIATVLLSMGTYAQAPQKMSYQSVVRDANQNLVTNQLLGTRVSIIQGSVFGPSVYVETHVAGTNSNGLQTFEIGMGTPVVGDFATIDWGNGPYFIKTETDLNGGANYTICGTSQVTSVPYALYALNSGSSTPGPQGPAGVQGPVGPQGTTGQSAYELWLDQGNTGTEADFLTSLQGSVGVEGPMGPQGPIGPAGAGHSAYDEWLLQGNTGTEADFLESLEGPQGPQGVPGAQGPQGIQGLQGLTGPQGLTGQSAYELWLSLGNVGTEADFLEALEGAVGAQGPAGPQGAQGLTGPQGLAGQSAYEIWLDQGNTGTMLDFLADLQGPQGVPGAQGPQGVQGLTGPQGLTGQSAYELWLSQGNVGTEADFMEALEGPVGVEGPMGPQGPIGPAGAGHSAYDEWLLQGNTGTEADFLQSLVGPAGPQGAQGPQGPAGPGGSYTAGPGIQIANNIVSSLKPEYLFARPDELQAGLVGFTTVDEVNGIIYDAGANEIILSAEKTYMLDAAIYMENTDAGEIYSFSFYDVTNGAWIGTSSYQRSADFAGDHINQPNLSAIITPGTNIRIGIRDLFGASGGFIPSRGYIRVIELK